MALAMQHQPQHSYPSNGRSLMSKIEPPGSDGDEQYGGTRNVQNAYVLNPDHQIGEGTYGQVYLATCRKTKDKVALKKIRMDNEKEGFPITAIREIKLLMTLQHENVVRLREIVRSDVNNTNNYKGSIYMVFDYADHDLTGLMERHGKQGFSQPQVKCIMKQLLMGLHFCHAAGVLHRDLKLSNLLVDSKGRVKLADFGLARNYQKSEVGKEMDFTNRVITLWYRPPELLLGAQKYGPEIDMWSVGCIFAELLCTKPIFPGKNEADQMGKIVDVMGFPTEATMPGCTKLQFYNNFNPNQPAKTTLQAWCQQAGIKDDLAIGLLKRLLEMDPKKRVSARDALTDRYFFDGVQACAPEALPGRYQPSHEYTMKQLRQKEAADKKRAAPHPPGDRYDDRGGQRAKLEQGGYAQRGAPKQEPGYHPGYHPQQGGRPPVRQGGEQRGGYGAPPRPYDGQYHSHSSGGYPAAPYSSHPPHPQQYAAGPYGPGAGAAAPRGYPPGVPPQPVQNPIFGGPGSRPAAPGYGQQGGMPPPRAPYGAQPPMGPPSQRPAGR